MTLLCRSNLNYIARYLALLLVVGWLTLAGPAAFRAGTAQEGGPSATGGPPATEPSDGAAASPATSPSVAASGQRTLLQSLMDSGVCGLLIFLLSILAVAMIVEHALTIRKSAFMPDDVVEQLDGLIREGRVNEAIELCHDPQHACLISNVVLAGLERFQGSEFGFAEFRAAAEEAGEDQTAKMYRKTEVLSVIGAIAPMLGLMGTVLGMIKSFNMISQTGGMARPDQLAGGISEALVTTLMGLVVAIPAMVGFSFFRNKIDSLVAEAGKRVEQVLMPLGRRR